MGKRQSIEQLIEVIEQFKRREKMRNPYHGTTDGSEECFLRESTGYFEACKILKELRAAVVQSYDGPFIANR
jgi:hypothetical protein